MIHPYEIEEREYRDGPRLWDADPDVCCAAFQLGACAHTEAEAIDYDDIELRDEEIGLVPLAEVSTIEQPF